MSLLLDEAAQDAALARMEMTDLWGVAGRLAARLSALGIATPLDLKRRRSASHPRTARRRHHAPGARAARRACLDLERETPDRKSIMASRSFGRPVTALAELREAVAAYTTRAAEKLRRQHLATASLMVFVETNASSPAKRSIMRPERCSCRWRRSIAAS